MADVTDSRATVIPVLDAFGVSVDGPDGRPVFKARLNRRTSRRCKAVGGRG